MAKFIRLVVTKKKIKKKKNSMSTHKESTIYDKVKFTFTTKKKNKIKKILCPLNQQKKSTKNKWFLDRSTRVKLGRV